MKKSDIVIFLVDCLRSDVLNKCVRENNVPGLVNFFKDRIEINNLFSVASTTTPAVGSLLTGCYPYKHNIRTLYGYNLNQSLLTLPQILKEYGYQTEAYVTGPLFQANGLFKDFDIFECRPRESYVYTEWGNKLVEIIERKNNKPRFILIHLWELHFPKQILSEYNSVLSMSNLYKRALLSLSLFFERKLSKICTKDKILILTGDHGEKISRLEGVWSLYKRFFFKIFNIKKIPDRMKYWYMFKRRIVNPLKHNTGNESFKIGHGFSVKEYLINIPLWMTNNPQNRGIRQKSVNSQVDIFTTILDMLNIPLAAEVDGISLLSPEEHESVYLEECISIKPDTSLVLKGIRTKNFKYICEPYSHENREELYNLSHDPHEKKNIALNSRNLKILSQMREMLKNYCDESPEDYLKGFSEESGKGDDEVIMNKLKQLGYF